MLIHTEHPQLLVSCTKFNLLRHHLKHNGPHFPQQSRPCRSPCSSPGGPCHRLRCDQPEPGSLQSRGTSSSLSRPPVLSGFSPTPRVPNPGRNSACLKWKWGLVSPCGSLETEVVPDKVYVYLQLSDLGLLLSFLSLSLANCSQVGDCLLESHLRAPQTLAKNSLKQPSSWAQSSQWLH